VETRGGKGKGVPGKTKKVPFQPQEKEMSSINAWQFLVRIDRLSTKGRVKGGERNPRNFFGRNGRDVENDCHTRGDIVHGGVKSRRGKRKSNSRGDTEPWGEKGVPLDLKLRVSPKQSLGTFLGREGGGVRKGKKT